LLAHRHNRGNASGKSEIKVILRASRWEGSAPALAQHDARALSASPECAGVMKAMTSTAIHRLVGMAGLYKGPQRKGTALTLSNTGSRSICA